MGAEASDAAAEARRLNVPAGTRRSEPSQYHMNARTGETIWGKPDLHAECRHLHGIWYMGEQGVSRRARPGPQARRIAAQGSGGPAASGLG
jgi:hypothetical protein